MLVLRPEPGAAATVAKARAAGLDARACPLFVTQALPWSPPEPHLFDALLFTSANAARLAGPQLDRYVHLPAFAVGQATGAAVRERGFPTVDSGVNDVQSLVPAIKARGHNAILHISGRDGRSFDPYGLHITALSVYAAADRDHAEKELTSALVPGMILLVHSPRAGARLARLLPAESRRDLHVVAISAAALAECGIGWASAQAAEQPRDDAILALAAGLCE